MDTTATLAAGFSWAASVYLASVLAGAGLLKVAKPATLRITLTKLAPRVWRGGMTPRLAVQLIAAWELLLAATLLLGLSHPKLAVAGGLSAAATFSLFVGAVVAAIRKGQSCGCFGSLSRGVAGGAELARTLTMALIALALAFTEVVAKAREVSLGTSGIILFALIVMTIVATRAGSLQRGRQLHISQLRRRRPLGAGERIQHQHGAAADRRNFLRGLGLTVAGGVGISSALFGMSLGNKRAFAAALGSASGQSSANPPQPGSFEVVELAPDTATNLHKLAQEDPAGRRVLFNIENRLGSVAWSAPVAARTIYRDSDGLIHTWDVVLLTSAQTTYMWSPGVPTQAPATAIAYTPDRRIISRGNRIESTPSYCQLCYTDGPCDWSNGQCRLVCSVAAFCLFFPPSCLGAAPTCASNCETEQNNCSACLQNCIPYDSNPNDPPCCNDVNRDQCNPAFYPTNCSCSPCSGSPCGDCSCSPGEYATCDHAVFTSDGSDCGCGCCCCSVPQKA